MEPEHVRIPVGQRTLDAELYVPEGKGPWPGVMILHEMFGLTSHVRADARSLAREGFLTLAPDLYSEGGMGRYCMKLFFSTDALANRGEHPAVAEVHRLLDYLKGDRRCDGKLGMIGMCLTGGFVLHMARRDDVVAPVVFHHAFGLTRGGINDAEAAEVSSKIQGHFGALDKVMCPKSRVDSLSRQLGEHLEVNVYPEVGHGLRSMFRHTPQAAEAWSRTVTFLHQHLDA